MGRENRKVELREERKKMSMEEEMIRKRRVMGGERRQGSTVKL